MPRLEHAAVQRTADEVLRSQRWTQYVHCVAAGPAAAQQGTQGLQFPCDLLTRPHVGVSAQEVDAFHG